MSNEKNTALKEQTYYHGKEAVGRKLAFASGEIVYNMPWNLISSFLAFFMTDIALIPAAAVGTLFLVCRVWDAINDPMIGSMADRTRTKMGRYRPWMLGAAFCLAPLVVLSFWGHPNWSEGARTAYGCGIYFLAVVAATAWNIPYAALNGVVSPYPTERASFSSYRITISSIACAASTALFLPLVTKFAGAEVNNIRGYLMAALVVCAITVPFMFTSILGTKEVVKAPPAETQQKFSAKMVWNCFSKNVPLLIVCAAFLVYGFLQYGRMTVGMYYFTYVWGDANLFTFYATANGLIIAAAAFFTAALVKMCKGKRGAMIVAYGIGLVANVVLYFLNPSNATPTVIMALLFVAGISTGWATALLYGMIGDTVDYGQWKTGVRADGLCSSGTSLMMKIGGALAPTLLMAMLAANGYVGGAATQPEAALSTMNFVMNMVPAILCAITMVLFFFYKLSTKKHYEILEELKARGEYNVE